MAAFDLGRGIRWGCLDTTTKKIFVMPSGKTKGAIKIDAPGRVGEIEYFGILCPHGREQSFALKNAGVDANGERRLVAYSTDTSFGCLRVDLRKRRGNEKEKGESEREGEKTGARKRLAPIGKYCTAAMERFEFGGVGQTDFLAAVAKQIFLMTGEEGKAQAVEVMVPKNEGDFEFFVIRCKHGKDQTFALKNAGKDANGRQWVETYSVTSSKGCLTVSLSN